MRGRILFLLASMGSLSFCVLAAPRDGDGTSFCHPVYTRESAFFHAAVAEPGLTRASAVKAGRSAAAELFANHPVAFIEEADREHVSAWMENRYGEIFDAAKDVRNGRIRITHGMFRKISANSCFYELMPRLVRAK